MSDYPATIGDLADVEARLDAALARLDQRTDARDTAHEQELEEVHEKAVSTAASVDVAAEQLARMEARVRELERIWAVALANPELIRELALEALKGKGT